MNEHTRTELHLSEEQLQQITGGCQTCRVDEVANRYSANKANLYSHLARIADHLELPDLAYGYSHMADLYSRRAQAAQDRIVARHGSRSDEPSSSEPPAKRPRLQ